MNLVSIILIPIGFGLFGFVEPCSLGINTIFLNHVNKFSKIKRLKETLIFTLIRGLVLALVGLSAAFIGKQFITLQGSLFTLLGVIYFILGLILIIQKFYPVLQFQINLSKFFKQKETLSMGIIFGTIIPACSIPFILALIGQAAIMQNLVEGFITLFVFGITLSLPLVVVSMFDKSNNIIRWLSHKTRDMPYIIGIILIIFGLLTIYSRSWWMSAYS